MKKICAQFRARTGTLECYEDLDSMLKIAVVSRTWGVLASNVVKVDRKRSDWSSLERCPTDLKEGTVPLAEEGRVVAVAEGLVSRPPGLWSSIV